MNIFGRALTLAAPGNLGANDWVHVATCVVMDIPAIVSADAGFDDAPGIRRVDPLDEKSLRKLLDA